MNFTLSDEVLLRFNHRDRKAFGQIYSALYPAVHLSIKRLIHEAPAARDLTADAFIRLWDHGKRFKSFPDLKSYLSETARNLGLDYLRHARIEQEKLQEIETLEQEFITASFGSAESHSEILEKINRAIDQLPRQCRRIFLLHYTKGFSDAEIAYQLNISEKTVSNQKSIAIKKLKIAIAKMHSMSVPIFFSAASHLGALLHFFKL